MTVRQLLTVPQDPRFVIIYVKDKDMKFVMEVQTLRNQTSDLVWDVVDIILSREKCELHARHIVSKTSLVTHWHLLNHRYPI
jgi:hypothetical protein